MAQAKQTKIACIGNSITFGARLTDPKVESYPAVLSAMLYKKGWRLFDSLKIFIPDIVIIKAGTNETVGEPRRNWEHINEFEKDYSLLLPNKAVCIFFSR